MKNKQQVNSMFAAERALRLRALRRYFRLSRDQLVSWCQGKVTKSTLRSWEIARFNGLTERGAYLIIEAFARHNIICSVEWLLFGHGQNPIEEKYEQESEYNQKPLQNQTLSQNQALLKNQASSQNQDLLKKPKEDIFSLIQRCAQGNSQNDEKIAQELRLFCELNLNAVDARVKDDALAPMLLEGDYVAGIRYFDLTSAQIINNPCIVHTLSGDVFVRVVEKSSQEGLYDLVSTNPKTKCLNKTLKEVKLISAAPILWIRRKGYL